ncbi:Ribose 5-phosphate isomerase B [Bacillus badius]|uniref:Ribose 5-phosphate isomerase B n=1 Tax=Bacillus badius TaxID=1455 RepID=A0ABR5AWL8_BACBA|nr:Ribose 5-phosphate isomerase B [Bacillus badius]KIL79152.1 Ribose 5-phosphate isomerase B [Bacillus badius]
MEGAKTPAGSAGQVRPRRRFSGEEAHRPPRGKRSSLKWKSTAPICKQTKKTVKKQSFSFACNIPNRVFDKAQIL